MERKKVAPGTRAANYRCSLPGLAGFVGIASPRAKTGLPQIQSRKRCSTLLVLVIAAKRFVETYRRRGRDSNPRYLAIHTISNRAPSATRTPLQQNLCGRHQPRLPLLCFRLCSGSVGGRGWSGGFGPRAQFRRSCISCSRSEREIRLRGLFEHGAQTRSDSGEGGIRTPGTLAGTPDFESGAIDRTLPPLQVVRTQNTASKPYENQLDRLRSWTKKSVSRAPHSAANALCSTTTRWFKRGSSKRR